jgi:signal transduction histidine kinase/streptogramin lyase
VNKSDPGAGQFVYYRGDTADPRRPSDYQVFALYEDREGLLWIGTSDGGLDRLDRETGAWRHYRYDPDDPNSLRSNSISAIHEDSSKRLWIATNEGFYQFDQEQNQFVRMPHNPPDPGNVQQNLIYTIYEDRQGTLWLPTHGRGLSEFNPDSGTFIYHLRGWDPETDSLDWVNSGYNFILDVVEDESGTLWVGTQDGLSRYDRRTGRWASYQHDPVDLHSLSNNWIRSLHLDEAGNLWVGTLGGGLNSFDRATETFTHYSVQDGLANDMVLDILESGGYLWICTANGLSRYDPRTETFRSYGASDGLPINEFMAAYASETGELFVGGINGFMSFYPGLMQSNPFIPPIVLTSLQQNGVSVDAGTALEDLQAVSLRWPDNSFEFDFAALNYSRPEKNQHAYKLEGFDSHWNYIGNRQFGRYTNLPGGTYTLRLKGSNNDGLWNETGTSIRVTIVPPFWETGWFWGIVIVSLAGGVFASYRFRVRGLEMRSRVLQQEVAARTAELQAEIAQRIQAEEILHRQEREQAVAEERNRLARELHDSVTQALYGVTLYAQAAAGHLTLGDSDQAADHLAELQDTAQEALAEMRLLVYELRPPILEQQGLVAALQARLSAVEGRAGLKTTFKTDLTAHLPLDVEEGLYRIAVEALNNALKHAQAQKIMVQLRQPAPPAGGVTLEVIDDGVGFDPTRAHERGGLGLQAMQERAAALGGHLTIWSKSGSGTRVTVTWPIDEGDKSDE